MDYHIENQCAKKATFFSRKIFCPIGCGLRLMRRDVIEHVSYYCQRRLSDCPFRCGQEVQFDKLRLHLYFCPKRPICCEPGNKECQKLFYKWFYCEDSTGQPGGRGFDGQFYGSGKNVSEEMRELFHQESMQELAMERDNVSSKKGIRKPPDYGNKDGFNIFGERVETAVEPVGTDEASQSQSSAADNYHGTGTGNPENFIELQNNHQGLRSEWLQGSPSTNA